MSFDKNLFVNYWHLICHKNELQHDGDFLKFETPIGDVVLFNDKGNIIAFDNKCPHRGAKIYQDDSGNQLASCPYHKWTYRNSKMIIPDKHRFIECNIDDVDLNKYRIEFCGDFIFFGVKPLFELHQQIGSSFLEILERISFSIEQRLDLNRYDFESYWAVSVENALESNHVAVIHAKTLGNLELEEGKEIYHNANSIFCASIGNKKMKKQLSSMRKFFDIHYQYEGYMGIYLFPFTTLNSTFGYSYGLQHFFPSAKSENETKFTSRILSSKIAKTEYREFLDPFFKNYALSVRDVFAEDHGICKLVPRDSWSMEPLKYTSQLENRITKFREKCRESN
jgi:phenylpropionate dioxygenase-like ring-hydroxylating dioxygenase large terminal subunit